MHNAMVRLPRKIAFLLLQKPTYVAPAIEALYTRDAITLENIYKALEEKKLEFMPEDLVNISVRFPKVAYAQLKSQDLEVPSIWDARMTTTLDGQGDSQGTVGWKLTTGFEMLLTNPAHQDLPAVREIKLTLEDLRTGDEVLPTDEAIDELPKTQDDERWLDIDFADLEHELGGSKTREEAGKKREFGDKSAQENLQRIVKQFEDFLNEDDDDHESTSDDETDDESDDHVGEDKDASFDEDEFTKLMQEMMGMPPEVMKELMSGKIDASTQREDAPVQVRNRVESRIQELDPDVDDIDEEHEDLEERLMEAELQQSGALSRNAVLDGVINNTNINSILPGSHVNKGKHREMDDSEEGDTDDDNEDDEDDDQDNLGFDDEFARNIFRSFNAGAQAKTKTTIMQLGSGRDGQASNPKDILTTRRSPAPALAPRKAATDER